MADNSFHVQAIASVYAQALINEAQKQNALAEITEDVRGIGELLRTSNTFRAFIEALTIGEDERVALLEKIFTGRVHVLTLNILISLSRRDRMMLLPGLVASFAAILKKMSGTVDAQLVSALELKPDVVARIKDSLGRSLNKTVDLHVKVDPALVGGITLTIGDTLIDGSVATQLEHLKNQLQRTGGPKMESAMSA